jgi:large-conductance mechanosensitive channel
MSGAIPREKSLFSWLKNEKILIIVLGVMIGDAVSRVVVKFVEKVFNPMAEQVLGIDPNKQHFVEIWGAKIQSRAFLLSIIEFALIILLAYIISKQF